MDIPACLAALGGGGAGTASGPCVLPWLGGNPQYCTLSLDPVVSTFAGDGTPATTDGIGTSASLNSPTGITTDGTSLFVAEFYGHTIRRIAIATGAVSTLAGSGSAGSADGTGTAATFTHPYGVTTDGSNLYITEGGTRVREIVISTGVVTTLAGSGSTGSADGVGTAATFNGLNGITSDGTNLYVADANNSLIRKIVISTAVVSTLAGTGSIGTVDGTGTGASFNQPTALTTDGTSLYVVSRNSHLVRRIVLASRVVATIAGSGSEGSSDGTGTAASFRYPSGITTDGTYLYVGDSNNRKVRRIVLATNEVTTIAGTGSGGSADGAGTSATFQEPMGVTMDGTSVFLSDQGNHTIRKLD